jgi:hypothetical protein
VRGTIQFHSPLSISNKWREMWARIFASLVLVAGEETRSSAGGQQAQVLPRAHEARARPRPASCCRYEKQSFGSTRLHGTPLDMSIARIDTTFQRMPNPDGEPIVNRRL